MEKNITPNKTQAKKPSFFKTFLYVLSVVLVWEMVFGEKKEELSTINPLSMNKKVEIKRNLVPFETTSLKGNFNTVGLRLDDIILKDYKKSLEENSSNIELLKYIKDETKENEKSSYVEIGLLTSGESNISFPTNLTNWQVLGKDDKSITLSWNNNKGVVFLRKLSFDDKYMLTVQDSVKNNSSEIVEFFPYARVVKAHDVSTPPTSSHTGFVAYLNNDLEEYGYSEITSAKEEKFNSKDGWLGFGSDYFMTMLVPDQNSKPLTARVLEISENSIPTPENKSTYKQFQADYVRDVVSLKSGEDIKITSRVYIGAKEPETIAKYETEFSIPKFDLVIDYGFFYILSKPFTQILKWFYDFTGNFGIAIILFTLLIRIILFPVAQKSFKSMEKMKKMQPEIKRIKTQYANNKQMMNLELAMLYKKSGVNPLSGCLPLLVQIPVFFALYKALVISIEMRQAPFMLWINDLSIPDPTSLFNLFGILPYTPYSWLPHIGILPIIMGVTMYIQQKMQPQMSTDETQNKIMKFLPILFTFMFAGLPSGLVLYWTVNNILSILQQKFMK